MPWNLSPRGPGLRERQGDQFTRWVRAGRGPVGGRVGAPALTGPNTAVWPEHRPWGSPATLACFDPHLHRSAKTLTSVLLTFLVCRMGCRRSSPAEAPAGSGVRLCSYGEGRLVASAPELRALVPSQMAVCPVGHRVGRLEPALGLAGTCLCSRAGPGTLSTSKSF